MAIPLLVCGSDEDALLALPLPVFSQKKKKKKILQISHDRYTPLTKLAKLTSACLVLGKSFYLLALGFWPLHSQIEFVSHTWPQRQLPGDHPFIWS